jgi:hypothetical protein
MPHFLPMRKRRWNRSWQVWQTPNCGRSCSAYGAECCRSGLPSELFSDKRIFPLLLELACVEEGLAWV